MLYKKIVTLSLTVYAFLTTRTFGGNFNVSSSATSCVGAGPGDICNFLCDIDTNQQSFDCGNVDICNIHCSQLKCLSTGIVNATLAGKLNVYSHGQECFADTNVYLPNTGGDSNFFDDGTEEKSYKKMIVNAGTNTGNIYIDCTSGPKEKCKQMVINAANADFLKIDIGASTDVIKQATINCPINSTYNGIEPTSCILNVYDSDVTLTTLTINTERGIPADVWIYNGPSISYSNVRITSINPSCDETQNEPFTTTDTCWNTNDPTTDPTTDPTISPSISPTQPPSMVPSINPSISPTKAPSHAPTLVPSISPTQSPSINPSNSPSINPSMTPTKPPSNTPSQPPTLIPSLSPSINPTNVPSNTPSQPPTNAPSNVPSSYPSYAPTQPPTITPSLNPTQPPSIAPSNVPSLYPSLTPTQPPSISPSMVPSNTPTQPPSIAPSVAPSIIPSLSPSNMPTLAPSNAPSNMPTINPSLSPSLTPTQPPTLVPSLYPSNTPSQPPTMVPSLAPTLTPSIVPSLTPTLNPSLTPTQPPSMAPSIVPSNTPTQPPSIAPSVAPSIVPSLSPSNMPTLSPSNAPSNMPTLNPSISPSNQPTLSPSLVPSINPTIVPSLTPSLYPSISPSLIPSMAPSIIPSLAPSLIPTLNPSWSPTQPPTLAPSITPSISPSLSPSLVPSLAPSISPSLSPSTAPTTAPTVIGIEKQFELFIYYNTTANLRKTSLQVFNHQFSKAMFNSIKYTVYGNNIEEYKFMYTAYTCIAFSVFSFTENDDEVEADTYQCDDYKKALKKSDKEIDVRFKPKTKSAKYLGLVRIVLTGNDMNVTEDRADNLTLSLLNDTMIRNNFIKFAEDCVIQNETNKQIPKELCIDLTGIEKFKIITLDAGKYVPPAPPIYVETFAEKFVEVLKVIIYVFIGLCLISSILGKIYAKKHKSDNVKAFGILFFSLYTWDFYSDIMFCVRLADAAQWTLCAVSIVFIFVPWIMNLIQLFQAQHKWTTDKTIQEGVRGWFVDWSIILIVAVAVSGNSFGAIELANSNLFGHDLFTMGLNDRHLKEFQSKRFYSSVLTENIPQLITQIYFLSILGSFDEATFIALLSSSISVILSVVDIWSAKRLVSVMDNTKDSDMNINNIEFNIMTNTEIEEKKKILLTRPKALSKAIGETLEIDPRTVEIYLLLASNDGIKIGFNVYAFDYKSEKMIHDLIENKKKLQLLITNYWHLKTFPILSEFKKGEKHAVHEFYFSEEETDDSDYNNNYKQSHNKNNSSVAIPLTRLSTIQRVNLKVMDPELNVNIRRNTELNGELNRKSVTKSVDDKPYVEYMNNLRLYVQNQLKVYQKHSLSNNKPIDTSYIDNNVNNNNNIMNLWKGYTNNISKLLLERNKLQFKLNNEYDDNNQNAFNLKNKWNKCMEYYQKTTKQEENNLSNITVMNDNALLFNRL